MIPMTTPATGGALGSVLRRLRRAAGLVACALAGVLFVAAPPAAGAARAATGTKTAQKGSGTTARAGTTKRTTSGKRAAAKKRGRRPAAPPAALVYHVESLDGTPLESFRGEDAINPASVTKVATTLWALERLGPSYRFETRFAARDGAAVRAGELAGDLVVAGGGDPDFQPENALLVARQLNEQGVRRVAGGLVVTDRFWMGYEGGRDGRDPNAARRAQLMAARLRQAFDPARWNGLTRRAWIDLAQRRGFDVAKPPKVVLAGATRYDPAAGGETLVVHRSRPLAEILRRMNAYSNNDIERVGENLGSPAEMSAWLAARLGQPQGALRFQTTSGLGENRLSPHQIVLMLRELRATCERLGLTPNDVLPAAGCDPGTVSRFFQKIALGPTYASVVGKTGTLTATDGGVSVFAGFAHTAQGELIFAVAQPRAAGRLRAARAREQEFVLGLVAKHGGPRTRTCAAPLGWSDEGTDVAPPALSVPEAPATERPDPVEASSLSPAATVN